MRFVLKAFTVLIATAAYSQDGLAGAAAARALEEEREAPEDFSMSMPMSMSMPDEQYYSGYDSALDCSVLQQMWQTDPKSIEGSDLMIIKKYCDEGLLSTAAEVAKTIQAFEGPSNPTVDEQLALLADQVCHDSSNLTSEDLNEVHVACEEDPRDDEKVIDVIARLASKGSPEADNAAPEEICISIEENRKEIEEGLLVLASRSDEKHRRLNDSIYHPVTSFEIGTDMLSFFDCSCDKSNPGNDGCAKKILLFAEDMAKAVTQKSMVIGENPAELLLKAHSSLEKHTNHLRQSGQIDPKSPEVYSSIERAMSEINEGKCPNPGLVEPTNNVGSYSLCLYAGPFFDCALSWDSYSHAAVSGSCGGGKFAKLTAEVKITFDPEITIELELKICIDVISDVIASIGKHAPGIESWLNTNFNIYGGCLRLAWAKYNVQQNRLETTMSYKRKFDQYPLLSLEIAARSWMRFKPDGCGYDDDITWFSQEMIAYNRKTGFLFGEPSLASDLAQILYLDHIDNNGCVQKAGPWAFFELTFALGHETIRFDWFNTRLETYHLWKESARFTATTNSNPSDVNHINANAYWSEFKTERNFNLCMDLPGSRTYNGNIIQLYHCHGGSSQNWYLDSLGRIRSRVNVNKCFDARDEVPPRLLTIQDCNEELYQQWELEPNGNIKSKKSGRFISVKMGSDRQASSGDQLNVMARFAGENELQQRWFQWIPPLVYPLANGLDRNLCMDVEGGHTHNGVSILLWDCHGGNNQKWYLDPLGRLHSATWGNKCLEATANNLHSKIYLSDCNDELNQKWEFLDDKRIRSKENENRYIGVACHHNGVWRGAQLQIQNLYSGTCNLQQQWYF